MNDSGFNATEINGQAGIFSLVFAAVASAIAIPVQFLKSYLRTLLTVVNGSSSMLRSTYLSRLIAVVVSPAVSRLTSILRFSTAMTTATILSALFIIRTAVVGSVGHVQRMVLMLRSSTSLGLGYISMIWMYTREYITQVFVQASSIRFISLTRTAIVPIVEHVKRVVSLIRKVTITGLSERYRTFFHLGETVVEGTGVAIWYSWIAQITARFISMAQGTWRRSVASVLGRNSTADPIERNSTGNK